MKKSEWNNFEGRIREVVSDPNNMFIPRQQNAGKIIDGYLIMHNGIKVYPNSYYGDFTTKMLQVNRGVHEPQEERVFAQVLPYIPEGGVIIELGAYWSFYSMWFYKEVRNALCYLIEPDKNSLEIGKKHFEINNMRGDFTLGGIGENSIKIDNFLKGRGLKRVDILHSDIQGTEFEMLLGARKSIAENVIKYFFISSHSQELHYKCLDFLKRHGYIIIASADFNKQTYCYDGVLVARSAVIDGPQPINIVLANWDTGNFLSNKICALCPDYLLPKLYLFYYMIIHNFLRIRIFLYRILPNPVKGFIKKILPRYS